LLADVDNFRLLNETHGHRTGDRLLRLLSEVIRRSFRESDVVGRYSSDEFLFLLSETTPDQALILGNRLLEACRAASFQPETGRRLPISLSIGIASYPANGTNRPDLLAQAFQSLNQSKREGGNRLTVAAARQGGFMPGKSGSFTALEGLLTAVDNKDHYTKEHSESVADYLFALAAELGIPEEEGQKMWLAGLFHDVGKICIPQEILCKPAPLDATEYAVVKQHPHMGWLIIRAVPQLVAILDGVLYHQEHWNGGGYPEGLSGADIPLQARLVAVVDAYAAMTTDRPYRKALDRLVALSELEQKAGKQFDPEVVQAFQRLVSSASFKQPH
jgi:diguanylate cyclase (GGDEF)-like protein